MVDNLLLIYTNGTHIDEKTAKILYENNTTVIFSLDSVREDTYKILTGGKGDLSKIKRNFEILKDIYQDAVEKSDKIIKTKLGVITIINNLNKYEIEDIKKFIGEDVFHIVNFPIKAGRAIKNWDLLVGDNIDELKDLADKYTDAAIGGLTASYKGKCMALYHGLTIDTDGEVLVCPASVETTVGNIRYHNIKELHEKVLEFIENNGSPSCIQRHVRKSVFKHHDGVSGTRV